MQQSIREQLVGAWKLVAYVEEPLKGGSQRFPLGQQPSGLILYTPDGYMSVQLMKPNRREFASGDWFNGTPLEYEEEAAGYIAYSGPYQVDEHRQTVTHEMFVSLFPNWVDRPQTRTVKFERARLHLSSAVPIQSGGATVMAYITWERAVGSE